VNLEYTATHSRGKAMPEKKYIVPLSDVDRMVIRQDRSGHSIISFSVQLEILVNGRWRKAMRFDSKHDQPHRHVFYPDGREYKEAMVTQDNNVAFTESQRIVAASFQLVHDRYIIYLEGVV
jgi:hypothetical protein